MIEEPVLTRAIMGEKADSSPPQMNTEPKTADFSTRKDAVNTGIRRHIKKIAANSVLYRLNAPRK
jgi:hypothetical protein